jgi:ubiquinone biosynthesis protein
MLSPLGHLVRRKQQLSRLAPIVRVLARHGFGGLAYRLSLGQFVPASLRRKAPPKDLSAPKRLRMALEDLGPTFVKLGQVLSTRSDLLPESYIVELRELTEHVPPSTRPSRGISSRPS